MSDQPSPGGFRIDSLHTPLEVMHIDLPAQAPGQAPPVQAVHAHGALGLCTEGEAQFWMGTTIHVRAGDIVLVPDGAPHFLVATPGYRVTGLRFCVGCLDTEIRQVLSGLFDQVRRGASPVRTLVPERARDVEAWLERLNQELAQPRPQRALAQRGLLALIAAEVARAEASPSLTHAAASPPVVADALRFIAEHASSAISLQDVARAVGRAPGHVATLVRQHTGRTVGGWIVEGRMAVARQLLLRTDAGVAHIAERVGYASLSHFHRAFKREHGVAPGAWRTAHR